jgi:hypothetical protein
MRKRQHLDLGPDGESERRLARLSSPAGSFPPHAHGWNDGEVIDIHPEIMELTLRIAAKTLFDSDVERAFVIY